MAYIVMAYAVTSMAYIVMAYGATRLRGYKGTGLRGTGYGATGLRGYGAKVRTQLRYDSVKEFRDARRAARLITCDTKHSASGRLALRTTFQRTV